MHTTLALSGAGWLSREFVTDNGLKQEVERQKLESIKTIRSQIEGPNIVDTIIAGVATLANVAVRRTIHCPRLPLKSTAYA